jgi:hypothetical protein
MRMLRVLRERRRAQRVPWRELEDLLSLNSQQFEEAVAAILRELGFSRVRVVGHSGDLSVDITCRGTANRLIAVQCKRFNPSNKVGSVEVQKFFGMAKMHHKADEALFVTTSDFTRPAYALAHQHDDLSLWNGFDLAELLANILGAPGRQIEDPAAALARDGLTPASMAAEARASDPKKAAEAQVFIGETGECPCERHEIRWIAHRSEGGHPILVCPYCERIATPEETHEAMIRGMVGIETEVPGLEPLRIAAKNRAESQALAEEDARLGLLFVHNSVIRLTRKKAARIALGEVLGREPTGGEVSELFTRLPEKVVDCHSCSECGAEMEWSRRLGAYWCQTCSSAEFLILGQFVRQEIFRPEVSGPPTPEWIREFLSDE